jgi:ankyrin repeat protein
MYMKEPSGTGVFADMCSHIRARDAAGLQACLANDKFAVLATDADGNTALHFAAVRGNVEAAAVLLQHGVDPDAMNAGGNTAMDIAAAMPDTAMVRCIIAKKRKYSGRTQSLQKKQMRHSSAKDAEDEDEVLVIRPAVRLEEWEPLFAEEQKQLREAFYRQGQKPPREEMASRVNNIDQSVRIARLCKQADQAAQRKAQDREALQNVSL